MNESEFEFEVEKIKLELYFIFRGLFFGICFVLFVVPLKIVLAFL